MSPAMVATMMRSFCVRRYDARSDEHLSGHPAGDGRARKFSEDFRRLHWKESICALRENKPSRPSSSFAVATAGKSGTPA